MLVHLKTLLVLKGLGGPTNIVMHCFSWTQKYNYGFATIWRLFASKGKNIEHYFTLACLTQLLWGIRPIEAFTVFNVPSRTFAVLVIPFSILPLHFPTQIVSYKLNVLDCVLCHPYLGKRGIDCAFIATHLL